jgi:hypothetical protein
MNNDFIWKIIENKKLKIVKILTTPSWLIKLIILQQLPSICQIMP